MPSVRPACRALLASAFAAVLCVAAQPARADTYSINAIENDNHTFYGMDDQGNVSFSFMGVRDATVLGSGACYQFLSPMCGTSANGRTVTAVQVVGTPISDLFVTDPGSLPQEIDQVDGLGQYFINDAGDILFDAGTADEWYEAFDVSAAPEPTSLLLLATGVGGLSAFAIRRRFLAIR